MRITCPFRVFLCISFLFSVQAQSYIYYIHTTMVMTMTTMAASASSSSSSSSTLSSSTTTSSTMTSTTTSTTTSAPVPAPKSSTTRLTPQLPLSASPSTTEAATSHVTLASTSESPQTTEPLKSTSESVQASTQPDNSSTTSLSTPSTTSSLSSSSSSSSSNSTTTTTPPPPLTTTTTSPASNAGSTNEQQALGIGIGVGVGGGVLLIIVIIIISVLVCRNRKNPKEAGYSYPNRAYTPDDQEVQEVLTPAPELKPQKVRVDELLDYVEKHQANCPAEYKQEYISLPGPKIKSIKHAKLRANENKNRFVNIHPWNENRVLLSMPESWAATEAEEENNKNYINASYIDSYADKNAYIATQGPLKETLDDFWKMVWEQNSSRIIMVANLMEENRPKCDQYWPNRKSEPEMFGKIKTTLIDEQDMIDFVLRTILIQKGEESRTVYQFHFKSWPDQDVPDNCTALLKFLHHCLKAELQGDAKGPPIIHCSAGVGRTGTLIAIDILLEKAKHEGQIDFVKCVEKLRHQRMYMVQSLVQYMFIHHAVLESLYVGKVAIPVSHLQMVYTKMTNASNGEPNAIERQFKVLNVLKPRNQLQTKGAKDENKPKNRCSTILPDDNNMPYLRPAPGENPSNYENYINAVFVHGCLKPRAYIATQMPLEGTRRDFWKLVKDYNCLTILMLNKLDKIEDRYWPQDGQTAQCGHFSITNISEISSDDIIITDLQIKFATEPPASNPEESLYANSPNSNQSSTDTEPVYSNWQQSCLNVRHIRLLNWLQSEDLPKDKSTLLSLYAEVVQSLNRNPDGHLLIHCMNGADRSGIFCALMNMMDTMKRQDEVDVFNSVKRIRKTRPEFIPNMKQYTFLYDLIIHHVTSIEQQSDYANFQDIPS